MHVFDASKSKFGAVRKGPEELSFYFAFYRLDLIDSTQDACNMQIPSARIDYILTDPPYAEKVQYGELNFIWEAWLGFDTHWHDEEIIVNEVRGKTEADWTNMMRQAMAECYRVLKPGRWLSLCYHDTSEGTWALIQDIMAEVGFMADQTDTVLSIDTDQKSYNQLTADKVNNRDLVINFRKPRPGELGKRRKGEKAGGTFQERVCEAIRYYLEFHPGSTKDRIYDHVVSRLVRSGRMEAHDFDELLRQVADEVRTPIKKNLFEVEEPNLFGTHEIRRWYLKETESRADQSDQSVADDATGRIEQFLIRQTGEELRKSRLRFEELQKKVLNLKAALEALDKKDDTDRKRRKIRQELKGAERQFEQLMAQRSEGSQHALHYTYISEFYFPLIPKPRATLIELARRLFLPDGTGQLETPAQRRGTG